LAGVVDFLVAFVVMLGMMVFYQFAPTQAIWTLPLFLLLALITALGVGLWLSALNVMYRDVGYVTPFLTQFWMYITPIAYPASLVPEKWRLLYALNPMTGVVEGFRWAMLGSQQSAPGGMLVVSTVISLVILISGLITSASWSGSLRICVARNAAEWMSLNDRFWQFMLRT
jgi:lipopolysaccharide transport system permease protein